MQRYDITLKEILRTPASVAVAQLCGARVKHWIDPHFPQALNMEADLVGELEGGGLVHFEIQSRNDILMPQRMFRYCAGLFWRRRMLPRQILLYVGRERLRMIGRVAGPHFSYAYDRIDIRDFDGEKLIDSPVMGDNVLAVLARLRNRREALHEILRRIAAKAPVEKDKAYTQLLTLAALRRLEAEVEKETKRMPVSLDLMKNRVIGPMIRRAVAEGAAKGKARGRVEGKTEGKAEGQRMIIRDLLEQRFGPLPASVERKISRLTPPQIAKVTVRILDVKSLNELFG